MSASAISVRKLPRDSRPPKLDRVRLALITSTVSVPVLTLLSLNVWFNRAQFKHDIASLAILVLVIAAVDLLPVRLGGDLRLSASLPVLLAAGMVFQPYEAGLLALIGSTDPREWKGAIRFGRALFNRNQIAVSVLAASYVFHALGGSVDNWPSVLFVGSFAVAVDMVTNFMLVAIGVAVGTHSPLRGVPRIALPQSPAQFVLAHYAVGLVAVVLVPVYVHAGTWGLLASLVPVAIARQMLVYERSSLESSAELQVKSKLLVEVSQRIEEERREERQRVAAGLHDEVLQTLYKVHLMGQVLRRDLDSGRLLDLDEDLPELLVATEAASEAIRSLIADLREPSIGFGGLEGTLRLLADDLMSQSMVRIEMDLQTVRASPQTQLLIYQVAREALQNAVRHAGAGHIRVQTMVEGSSIRLLVQDDGMGFDPVAVDKKQHFGLQMMRERAEFGGGTLIIDSQLGEGTRVVARFHRT